LLSVSVIVPNYNHSKYLKQRIESVLGQTFRNFELIILDDCSTDESKKIIESFRQNEFVSNIVYNEKNSGSTFKQWQKGILLAKGDFIWIAESDDVADLTFLETATSLLQGTGASLFFCQSHMVTQDGENAGDYFWWTRDVNDINWGNQFVISGKDFIKKALRYKNVIPNASAVVFKKQQLENSIKRFSQMGDWLFWLQYLEKNNVCYTPKKLNYFRTHLNTTRQRGNIENEVRYWLETLYISYFLRKHRYITQREHFQKIRLILINTRHNLFLSLRVAAKLKIPLLYRVLLVGYKIKVKSVSLWKRL
jgi:glycosyltransferase involved in cell wall biosynthesis